MTKESKALKAREYFEQGYNCAQAVAAAFSEEMGLEESAVLGLASGFGGGMAGMRQMCGAVSGMLLVVGQIKGHYPPEDFQAKKDHYARLRDMAARMEEQYGSLNCGELLRRNELQVQPDPSPRDADYYARRPCARYVETCAGILEQELESGER